MRTVYTAEEFNKALEDREEKILVKGELAQQFKKKKTRTKIATVGGAVLAAGRVAAIPFTGGASAAGVAIGAGLTIGTVTISTTELAIICGTVIALKGIDKGCKVKFSPDGGVEVSPQYKE